MTSPITELLIEEAEAHSSRGRSLVLGGEAELANALVSMSDRVDVRATDVRELGKIASHVVAVDDIQPNAYERVLLPVPPDRALTRRWLLTAWEALVPGGDLLLAGANAEGGKSAVADARAIFGDLSESYRQRHRIARAVKTDEELAWPLWADQPGMRPGSWQSFDVRVGQEVITLETQPGVFAGGRLDIGTGLLLDHLAVERGSRVLDVGSGAGVIGIAAGLAGAEGVTLVDANLLAVEASARNLANLGVAGRAIPSDIYAGVDDKRFDLIVSNPPFHRGKQVDSTVADALITGAPAHLLPDGRLLLVANAFLAYGKQMERVFRHVETIAATRQFHVLLATTPRQPTSEA